MFKLYANNEQIVCNHRHTDKNTSCYTSRVAFIAKTDMPSPVSCASVHKSSILYKCIQNQFTVQVYTVHLTSSPCKCTQNQFSVQFTSLHKASLLVNNERNVQGQNITKECAGTKHY